MKQVIFGAFKQQDSENLCAEACVPLNGLVEQNSGVLFHPLLVFSTGKVPCTCQQQSIQNP